MRTTLNTLIAIVGIALFTPSVGFSQSQSLTGSWQLSYIKDTLRVAPNGAARPNSGVQLTFGGNGTNGHFYGTFYCNGVAGDYSIGGNSMIKVVGRDTTNNPCYDEKKFWVYFSRISTYKVVNNTVIFVDYNGTDKLIFTKEISSNQNGNSQNSNH